VQSFLGEHRQFHGKLMSEIREKRGMNYGDYAYVEKFIQEGGSRFALTNIARRRQHFEIWIRPVAPHETVFALRLALMLLDQTIKNGLSQAEVESTRQFLDGYTRLWEMTPMRRLGYALDDHFYGTSAYLESVRKGMGALDLEKVNESMRRHLVPGPVAIAIIAPNAQQLLETIVAGVETPKSYEVPKPEEVVALDREAAKFPLSVTPDQVRIISADQVFEE
jgi:zinc protease